MLLICSKTMIFKKPISVFSTLFRNICYKKQETEGCVLKICGSKYHHGTYTPLWGASALLLKPRHTSVSRQYTKLDNRVI